MILAHGCSHTHGTWHSHKYGYNPWPEVAGELLEEDCVNIATTGHNCQAISFEIIDWCAKNYIPDKIFIGWPSFNRLNNFTTWPNGWQIDLIGESIVNTRIPFPKKHPFVSHIFNKETFRNPKFMNINTFLAYQKIMAMSTVQNFCKLNNIEYYYFSWDAVPWIFLPEYEKAAKKLPYNKEYIFSEELIRQIEIENNVFWDWIPYSNCKRSLHEWWYCNGMIGHGEQVPEHVHYKNSPDLVFDHHWGKDMHDKMGEIFYNFIKFKKKPNPTDRNMELFLKRIKELNPKDDHIPWYLETYEEYMQGVNDKPKDEITFIYD